MNVVRHMDVLNSVVLSGMTLLYARLGSKVSPSILLLLQSMQIRLDGCDEVVSMKDRGIK